ncbi:MAG: MFS transporter [Gammaproteobacteria bacterium]|nr:MFS transporter [Gammaproteobacteria bacterium]
MKSIWLRTVCPIAAIFACRMLGLFLLIPVFTLYAPTLKGSTPALIGLALGAYGLSQGILQIPFGMLSDRYGRKPIIMMGLVLFALGSALGAITDSMLGMILARILQGMGAIGSVLMALLADLTPESKRTPAMAIIGGSIGLSFNLALVISPPLALHSGLSGIFIVTLSLACLGLLLLKTVIPTPQKITSTPSIPQKKRLLHVLANPKLRRLNLGIFCQHAILTATFFILPLKLQTAIDTHALKTLWHFYLPTLVIAFLAAIPLILLAERRGKSKLVFSIAIGLTGLSQVILTYTTLSWSLFCVVMFIYFLAFNALEAMLPSLVSKQTTSDYKGTAMGVYSSSQFLGIFVGGSLAGLLYQHYSHAGVFIVNALIAALWLSATTRFKKKGISLSAA